MSASAAAAEGLKRFRHGEDDGTSAGQRWLVCVDGSDKSKAALRWALNAMTLDTDLLILLSVVELVVHSIPHPSDYFKQLEEHMNKHSREHAQKLLEEMKKNATTAGVWQLSCTVFTREEWITCLRGLVDAKIIALTQPQAKHVDAVLLESKVPKEAIVKYVEEHKVDNLILGRRGMSEAERHLMGSTSEYCIRHAYANVVVVK